jgi:hypothetical protein
MKKVRSYIYCTIQTSQVANGYSFYYLADKDVFSLVIFLLIENALEGKI